MMEHPQDNNNYYCYQCKRSNDNANLKKYFSKFKLFIVLIVSALIALIIVILLLFHHMQNFELLTKIKLHSFKHPLPRSLVNFSIIMEAVVKHTNLKCKCGSACGLYSRLEKSF